VREEGGKWRNIHGINHSGFISENTLAVDDIGMVEEGEQERLAECGIK
jgi:hypothetical protein